MSEMTSSAAPDMAPSGFCFDNLHRNAMVQNMASSGNNNNSDIHLPSLKKTGTTIAGAIFKDGVILGADTRATNGDEIAEKNCLKIHYLAPNMYVCGAGTAADCDHTTALIASQLELLRMETHSPSRVCTACTLLRRMLFRYQGYVQAALILGGCDVNGPQLYQLHPHGSTASCAYTTMGSGSMAAMAVLEVGWQEGMSEEEASELVKRAILAGIFNDLGSGSNVDLCVIRLDGTVEYTRGKAQPNDVEPLRALVNHSSRLTVTPGTTPVLKTSFQPYQGNGATLADVTVTEMETS